MTGRDDIGISRRGLMLVLSSPSGAGKTTISRELLLRDSNVVMSVSVTAKAHLGLRVSARVWAARPLRCRYKAEQSGSAA